MRSMEFPRMRRGRRALARTILFASAIAVPLLASCGARTDPSDVFPSSALPIEYHPCAGHGCGTVCNACAASESLCEGQQVFTCDVRGECVPAPVDCPNTLQ